ncbi:MAG: RepB family plasmid replication initiator protein [Rickettsiales bacterium]|nr:MAG: RepB family plasmid replication initiator protein [Rickettsiales bacterium]
MTETITGKNELIKHTAAIHVTNTISIIERKISNILLKNSFQNLSIKEKHSITIRDIISLLGWSSDNNQELIKASLRKLNSTQIEWNILGKDKKNEWGVATIISSAKISKGICEYSYSPILRELLAIPNIYAKLNMAIQAKFSSKYSLALWEFLIEMLCRAKKNSITTQFIELESIKKILGANGIKIYEEFKILNRDILKKAICEINSISDIDVEHFTKKHGKRVAAIAFKISKKQDFGYPLLNLEHHFLSDQLPLTQEENQSIHNDNNIFKLLTTEFGISSKKAHKITNTYSSDKLDSAIRYTRAQVSNNKIRSISAYFVSSLKEEWNLKIQNVSDKHYQDNNLEEPIIEADGSLWSNILKSLKNTYGTPLYISWFSKLQFSYYDDACHVLCLKASTDFFKNWIESNYKKHILNAAQKINAQIRDIQIIL